MSIKALQEYTRISKYARFNPEKKRRETWDEQVSRVFDMHQYKFGEDLIALFQEDFDFAERLVRQKRILGSQRALQFGGAPILSKNARMYNCFAGETEFITSEGVKRFSDCKEGNVYTVLTHKGNWKEAVVKSYGDGQVNKIVFSKGRTKEKAIFATEDHRWILADGQETTNLKEGDKLYRQPAMFEDFCYDNATPMEKLYWAYGMVYGDGTRIKNKKGEYQHSMIRLCNHDRCYTGRFEELGFKTSSSCSLNGDFIAYTGSYLKTLPSIEDDDVNLVRAFVRGFLDADGEKNKNCKADESEFNGTRFISIQQTSKEAQDFIRNVFPSVGVYVISETEITRETNFGKHDAVRFKINTAGMLGTASIWKAKSIDKSYACHKLWCLEVEDDQSFVMPNGIVTGNCTSSYCDRPRFFQECMYLLLCGCGAGFSVQTHHVAQLPKIKSPLRYDKGEKEFIITDDIEGWANSIGILLSSYFDTDMTPFPEYRGYKVKFNFDLIRPAGAPISSGSKAPGPDGLKAALIKIDYLLDKCAKLRDSLRPIDAYDIVMHASDAVLSGGVRRSATICVFSPEDTEMLTAKIGSWRKENPQRGRSNNSVLLIRDETTKEDFEQIISYVKEFGEPGFVWADDKEFMVNPCITEDAWIATADGIFQVKDLVDVPKEVYVDGELYPTTEKGFFATGKKPVYRLTTSEGFEIEATHDHKFMNSDGEWMPLSEFSTGDKIKLHNHKEIQWNGVGTDAEGWLLGSLLGDGTFVANSAILDYWGESRYAMQDLAIDYIRSSNLNTYQPITGGNQIAAIGKRRIYSAGLKRLANSFSIDSNKEMSDEIEKASYDFYKGFLRGYFDADGGVQGDLIKGVSIRLSSVSVNNLQRVQRMLLRMGIYSKIYKNRRDAGYRDLPDGNGGSKRYYCRSTNELVISNDSIVTYYDKIGFSEPEKMVKLYDIINSYKRTPNRSKFVATVEDCYLVGKKNVYDCTVDIVHAFDANGFYVHNCCEIGMLAKLKLNKKFREKFADEIIIQHNDKYLSGWQTCNLCEINMKKAKTEEDFLEACRAAAVLGTLQSAYTSFDYLGEVSEEIVKSEALLGVSMTGMADNPDIAFDPKLQRKGAKLILEVNERIAKIIGVNKSARATCVKPSGTSSCILGTASGIHPHHAKRYFRRVQANVLENTLQYFELFNPLAVEESVWSTNNTDKVIIFLCEVPDGAKTKNTVDALTMLEHVKLTQQNWVEHGTRIESCLEPWLRHNVSNTITIKPDEWKDVATHIFRNRKWYTGISMLPMSGDKDYPQAPFTAVSTPIEIVRLYGEGSIMASGLIVDGLRQFGDNLWEACDCVLGVGEIIDVETLIKKIERDCETNGVQWKSEGLSPESPKKLLRGWLREEVKNYDGKKDWVRRAKQFASRYFKNDVKNMTYCLKDVANWKLWCDLNREYMDVDWSNCHEDSDENTEYGRESACSGGKCELGDLGISIEQVKSEKSKRLVQA